MNPSQINEDVPPPRAEVVFAIDTGYVHPTVVAMHSLLKHWGKRALRISLVGEQLSDKHVDFFRRVAMQSNASCELRVIHLSDQLKRFPKVGHLTPSTFTRAILPQIIPDIDELLYLDGDLLILRDLSDFPTAGYSLGLAAQEVDRVRLSDPSGIPYCLEELGLSGDLPLFNPGVFVMNSRLWRQEKTTEQVIAFVDKFRDQLRYSDQDAINAVCVGRIGQLDYAWNTSVGYEWPPRPGTRVLHYTGSMKPWNSGFFRPSVQLWLNEAREAFAVAGLSFRGWSIRRLGIAAYAAIETRLHRLKSSNAIDRS